MVGIVAYILNFPEETKIHLVFHVSLLSEFRGDVPEVVMPLPKHPLLIQAQPKAIID